MTAPSCRMTSFSKRPIVVIVNGSTSNSLRLDVETPRLSRGCRILRPWGHHNQNCERDPLRRRLIPMAITTQKKRSAVEAHRGKNCVRCQGATVSEVFVDWTSGGGHLSFPGQRCLLCGDITDSVILSHRTTHPQPGIQNARHSRGHSITAEPTGTRRQHSLTRECPQ
jgi:hypothetical protein